MRNMTAETPYWMGVQYARAGYFLARLAFFGFALLARGWRGLTSACGSGLVASIRRNTSSVFMATEYAL